MRVFVLIFGLVLTAAQASASTIYTYTGQTFGAMLPADPTLPPTVTGPYELTDSVSGFLEFADILIPTENLTTFAHATALSYSFSDGVQTLTQDNSRLIFSYAGTLTLWSLTLTALDGSGTIQSYDTHDAADDIGLYLGSYGHVAVNPNHRALMGTWTVTTVETPEPATWMLIGMAFMLLVRPDAIRRQVAGWKIRPRV